MSRMGWSPGTVPYGADQTVYLVVDRLSSGSVYRETEVERTDLETIIDDFLTGQFNDPVCVVAFNTLEHWANDVSKDIAQVIQDRCDMACTPVPDHVRDFVDSNAPGCATSLSTFKEGWNSGGPPDSPDQIRRPLPKSMSLKGRI